MLVQLRPFISASEDVYFPSIHNVLMQRLTDERLRDVAIQNQKEWKRLISGWGFGRFRTAGGKTYGRYDLFDLAMKAEIFHHDLDKEREYESLPPLYRAFAKAALYDIAFSTIAIIFNHAAVITAALEQKALKDIA